MPVVGDPSPTVAVGHWGVHLRGHFPGGGTSHPSTSRAQSCLWRAHRVPPPPPPRDLLERGGGGGAVRRNIPNPQGTEKLLENEQLSTWKCHVVGRKQRKFIIECQFRVPTSHQYTTTTTKRDIHHLMPNDSDLPCQSELDSPELEPPSVVELELEPDDDEPESLPEWETSDKLSNSTSSSSDSGSKGTSAFSLL